MCPVLCYNLPTKPAFRYDEQIEKLLDEAYESYVAKKEGSTKQRKRSKQAHAKDELLEVLEFTSNQLVMERMRLFLHLLLI